MPLPLSAYIIARNEAERIGRTIAAIRDLADEVIVVDSGSTDGTQDAAQAAGARVISHAWEGYGRQKRFAEAQCRHDWLLNLDADEVVTPALHDEIQALFSAPQSLRPAAYALRIIDVIPGDARPRRFAYAHKYVRLYHKDAGRFSTSTVHDVVHVNPGFAVRRLRGAVHHFSITDIATQVAKYNQYTDALVDDMQSRNVSRPFWRLFTEFPASFLKAYVLRRHFMRGRYGFVTAMNYAFFRYLRLAKYYEQRRNRR